MCELLKKPSNLKHTSMKTKIIILLTICFQLNAFNLLAQVPSPAPEQKGAILLQNGIAHLGNGEIIENSVIGFKDGKLTLVADAKTVKIDPSFYDTIINIEGKHVYPGIIAP